MYWSICLWCEYMGAPYYFADSQACSHSEKAVSSRKGDIDARVPGRIHRSEFRAFWVITLQASSMHLSILEEGYKLPFISIPPKSVCSNNKSALQPDNFDFVCQAIENHVEVGAVSEVFEIPDIVMPLQVVAPVGRKKRLITDASRQLNPFLKQKSVKLDNLQTIANCVVQFSWFGVMDLSSGYYHIKIHPPHTKYLGFSWVGRDKIKRYYVWNIAFLGLSPLVNAFTKIQKPIIAHLRRHGIQCYIYIDDMIIFGNSKAHCANNMEFARRVWQSAGWIENKDKAREPVQRGEYLGLELDTISLSFHVPQHKKDFISVLCGNVARQDRWPVKVLASVYGKLLANLLATGPQLLLLTRKGLKAIAQANTWDETICLGPMGPELLYLAQHFKELDGYPMCQEHNKMATSSIQTASDASAQAVAVVKITCNQGVNHSFHEGRCGFGVAVEAFSRSEQSHSSTWRELCGLLLLLRSQRSQLSRKSVVHWTDSKNVERIMAKGSSTEELQNMALNIYTTAKEIYTDLRVIWRPRADPRLQLADDFSRAIDVEDYGIDDESFGYLQTIAEQMFDFDLFASDDNFRTEKFASILASNRALFRDAFTHSWADLGFCYAHPPVNLVGPTIRKIVKDSARGILVLPLWRTMKDWLLVCSDGIHFNNVFRRGTAMRPRYRKGSHVLSSTFQGFPSFPTLALEFNGGRPNPLSSVLRPENCSLGGCNNCRFSF